MKRLWVLLITYLYGLVTKYRSIMNLRLHKIMFCLLLGLSVSCADTKKRSSFLNSFRAPPGARTLDPNIKSVVLYQLS